MSKLFYLDDDAPVWAQLVYTGLRIAESWSSPHERRPSYSVQRGTWALLVPYCVHETKLRAFVVVNRDYHALGCTTFTNYETATAWHISHLERERLRHANVIDAHGFLYDDRTAPYGSKPYLTVYLQKLLSMLEPWRHKKPEAAELSHGSS